MWENTNNKKYIAKQSSLRLAMLLASSWLLLGCAEGFKSLTDEQGLAKDVSNPDKKNTHTIATTNARFARNYPSIFYLKSSIPDDTIEVIVWEHWYGIGEKCPSPNLNADGSYHIDCGTRAGNLAVFLSFRVNEGKEITIFKEVVIEDVNLSEDEVFPEGRSL